jgi:diguanylate cyclase (GGDEF)-like protein
MCHHVIDLQSPRKAIMEVKARPPIASEEDAHSREQLRLAELSRYAISTERPDPKLDIITRLAVAMLGGAIGGISIVQQDRIWLPSRVGVDAESVSRAGSFCNWVVQSDGTWFEVEDACADPRFADNPLVTQAPFCRHYAAVPLHGARGYLLGTLWVMRQQPGRLDADQMSLLNGLGRLVIDTLELRYTNDVTGMPNRAAFLRQLELGLSGGCADGDQVMVGFIDLLLFRHLNEAFGRVCGNHALRTIGQRLTAWCGLGNLTAHVGSDKFAFALFGTAGANAALLERLRDCVTAPITMGPGGSHAVHARIGIERRECAAAGPVAALLDAAETAALSASSELSVTTLREYGADLLTRSQLLIELRRTLQGERDYGALQVHYQPQVDVAAGRLVGMEALVRWAHPQRGLVPPGEFIGLAESSDQIYALDRLVLLQVCADLRDWRAAGLPVVPVSLNFSRRSLLHPQAVADVTGALAAHGLPGTLLELEITESQLLEMPELVSQRVAQFRALGVCIAVDDFGTGYSNLDAISNFTFDRLKVDRQFVHGVAGNARIAGLFKLIQGMAELFGVELVCEGVEDEADLDWLLARGAACVQGWYFSRARTAPSTVALLAALGRRAPDAPPLDAAGLRRMMHD